MVRVRLGFVNTLQQQWIPNDAESAAVIKTIMTLVLIAHARTAMQMENRCEKSNKSSKPSDSSNGDSITVIVTVELFDYASDRHVGDDDRTSKKQLISAMGKRTLTLMILRKSSTNRRKTDTHTAAAMTTRSHMLRSR